MNKSLITNMLALLAMLVGWFAALPWLWTMGLFAFSGAITNWLAVHMLFEKVPLLYGSGVIPARFEQFKAGIYQLVMTQFFSSDNIDRFLADKKQSHSANKRPRALFGYIIFLVSVTHDCPLLGSELPLFQADYA